MSGYLLSFASTHDGIQVRMRMRNRFRFTVLPTPREIQASCGISIRVEQEDLPQVRALLLNLGLDERKRVMIFEIRPTEAGYTYPPLKED